jgi:hypothetical protein
MATVVEKMSDGSWRSRQITRWSGPMVESRLPEDFCYICEHRGADSIEHIFAECFFAGTVSSSEGPQPRTHTRCNQLYSAPEEYVRNRLASFDAATGRAAEAARAEALAAYDVEGAKRGLDRQHAIAKRERHRLEVRREGNVRFWIPEKTDTQRWLAVFFKMVRGWLYSAAGLLLPWPAECEWELHVPYEGPPIGAPNMRLGIGDGLSAIARVSRVSETTAIGVFELTFYRGIIARVVVGS